MPETTAWVIVSMMFAGLAIALVLLVLRHRNQMMLHQERLAALEKGTSIPLGPEPTPWTPRVYLLRGLIWSFSGAAVIVALLGISWATVRPVWATNVAMNAKNISERLEIPIDQAKQLAEKDAGNERRGIPPGIAVLGVIPFAVGLAYLVFYFTDDSRKRVGLPAPPV